jgi:MoaA/NifB/PqqE/SkfB family radical SAM enzyme
MHRKIMKSLSRIIRYGRIAWKGVEIAGVQSPPILILFINSVCNLRCEHCVYWRNLNRKDDLTKREIFSLARNLGRLEILALSGGEPFLRKGFAEICRYFIQNNKVEQIYVPTNGYHAELAVKKVEEVLKERNLNLFVVEISLDGMPDFHNRFRGSENSFQKAMETYDTLVNLQKSDPRLRIHAVSTATEKNIDEIGKLTSFLYSRCPAMDHHNIALIRGDRKNPSLRDPDLVAYEKLHEYTRSLWAPRERGRYGATVEPMLQWAKVRTKREQKQVIPCRAGLLSAVVYANGDVGLCEFHPPLGNLREKSFMEVWRSGEAQKLRASVRKGDCYCSNEVFLWPSIVFQPLQLFNAMLRAKVWKKPAFAEITQRSDENSVYNPKKESN